MLFVILPAYNEEKALPSLLPQINRVCYGLDYQVVVVDDGSNDQTAELVLPLTQVPGTRVVLLKHADNRGLGQALLTGFKYVAGHAPGMSQLRQRVRIGDHRQNVDVIVTLDADNTHPPELIPLLYEKILAGEDIAIASRYVQGGGQLGLGAWRRLLSWGASKIMQEFFPLPGILDYSCGYRAYRVQRVLEGLQHYGDNLVESRSFAAMVEVLLKLVPFCNRFVEIPLELHYERKEGPSKMKVWATMLGYVNLIITLKKLERRAGAWQAEAAETWPEEWVRE